MNRKRLLMIGLDGASWNVLNPLMKEGVLPNLQKLKNQGLSRVLRSVFPPVTGSAWMSIATGKNAGQTGVFDFYVLNDRQNWKLVGVNGEDFRQNGAIWDYLGNAGKKVGVINYPVLYKPYHVNGVMVSGLGAPEDGDLFYPPELKYELEKKLGKHKIYVPFARPKYKNPELFIKDIKKLIDYNSRLAEELIDDSYDFFEFVISASDFVCHYGWDWLDDRDSDYYQAFREIWSDIDRLVGSLVEKWQGGDVMVISDHGMGKLKEIFLVNKWLQSNGYLVLKGENLKSTVDFFRRKFKVFLRKVFDVFIRKFTWIGDCIYVNISRKKAKKDYKASSGIDFGNSRAFALAHSGVGHIYINTKVVNENDYDKVREEIISKLKKFCQEQGRSLEVYLKEEIYHGPKLDMLPGILFMIEDNAIEVVPSMKGNDIFRKPLASNKTGSHRMEGVLMAVGNGVDYEQVVPKDPQLTDIYPIISRFFGVDDSFVAGNDFSPKQKKITGAENHDITKHLKDLGYL